MGKKFFFIVFISLTLIAYKNEENQEKYKELIFTNDIIDYEYALFLLKMYSHDLKFNIMKHFLAKDAIYNHENPETKKLGRELLDTLPHRILLVGPPGMEKTSLARYIANQTRNKSYFLIPSWFQQDPKFGIPFIFKLLHVYTMHGSSASFVIDDIDKWDALANSEMVKLLYKLLDESQKSKNILIIATANDIDSISEEIKKQFSKICYIGKPNESSRLDFLKFFLIHLILSPSEEKWFLEKTENFSFYDIKMVIAFATFSGKGPNSLPSTLSHVTFNDLKNIITNIENYLCYWERPIAA